MTLQWYGQGQKKFWLLGDSNVEGSGVAEPWMVNLAARVDDRVRPSGSHRTAVTYLGHRGSFRYKHSGTSGITAQTIAGAVAGYSIGSEVPTDAFILAGINDLAAARTPAQIKADVEAIRNGILARYPSCRVWICALFPNGSYDVTATNAAFAAITGLNGGGFINGHIASWVIATHMQSGTNVHPNQVGHDKFAFDGVAAAMIAAGVI